LNLEGETFALLPYAEVWRLAIESAWANLFVLLGTVRLAILIVNNGLERRSPHLHFCLAGVSAVVWAIFLERSWYRIFRPCSWRSSFRC
jgi:MFS superfamily sulfate permease-like transporter